MAFEFEVDFTRAIAQSQELQARLMGLGKELDGLEKSGRQTSKAYQQFTGYVEAATKRASSELRKMGVDQAAAARSAGEMARQIQRSAENISNAYVGAATRAEAMRGTLGDLRSTLTNTRAEQQYANTQLQIATALSDASNRAELYRSKLETLTTAEGRAAVESERLYRQRLKSLRAMGQEAAAADSHVRAYQRVIQQQQAAARATANYRAIIQQMVDAQREMAVTGQSLAFGYQRLTDAGAKLAAQQQVAKTAIDSANQAMIEGHRNIEQYTGANARAAQMVRTRQQIETQAAEARKRELAELRQAIEQRARAEDEAASRQQTASRQQADALRRHQEAVRHLGEAEARTRAERDQQVRGAQAYNQAMERNAAAAREASDAARVYATQLGRATGSALAGSAEKLNQQFINMAARGREATASLRALTTQEALLQVQEERLNNTLQLRNQRTLEQARANQTLTSAEARLTDAVRRQTEEYKRRAQYAQMTNMQLLGMSRGVDKLSRDMHMNAQAAAMFRAALGGMNASIGIYTSSTVLAASATYAFAAALRNTVTTGMEFTETMSRAEAVMMTGVDSITSAARSMEGLEMQVRALGASTIFTATEVAGGLVDLGMAGLSANEALTALKPALDLASIGGIEMSESADIATNVMTSFKMSASDLTEVVDILATAVTNSNTTISQLANALSYVGPAAEAAGFDLRDTVAAIELLSNAGIKASRAGTGLRRFMLNIQNPTAKGAEVLREYGIALDDAEGNTRSLMDILGQFNQALHNDGIAPSERMAAVVDLVGVRAASAVSRMIGSVGELGVLRRQLDDVAGAAEEMRQKIEDNLSADWKQVKSAFQDLQLEVFDEFQWHLRELAASTTLFFRTLTEEGPEGISKLDELIASAHMGIDVIKGLGTAFLVFKGFNVLSTMAGASASSLGNLADRMAVLNARGNLLQASQFSLAAQMRATAATAQAHAANIWYANSATERLTATANAGALALQGLARSAALVGTAFGWAGVVYGIYQAVSSAFGGTTGYLEDHKTRVNDLEDSYNNLNAEIEKTQHAAMQGALEKQGENLRTELDGVLKAIRTYSELRLGNESSDFVQALDDRLLQLRLSAKDTGQALRDNLQAQSLHGVSQAQLASTTGEMDETVAELNKRLREREAMSFDVVDASGREIRAYRQLSDEIAELESRLSRMTRKAGEARESSLKFSDELQRALKAQGAELEEEARRDRLSVTEALIEAQQRLADAHEKTAEMQRRVEEGGALAGSLGEYKQLEEAALKAQEEVHELMERYIELSDTAVEAREELDASRRSDAENADLAREALKELNAELLVMKALSADGEIVDVERLAEVFKQIRDHESTLLSYRTQQEREAERLAREAKRAADARRREIEQMMQVFNTLRGSFDPVGVAMDEFREKQQALNELLSLGRISAEQYGRALRQLEEDYQTELEFGISSETLDAVKQIAHAMAPAEAAAEQYQNRVRALVEALNAGAISQERFNELVGYSADELLKVVNGTEEYEKLVQRLAETYDSQAMRLQSLQEDEAKIAELREKANDLAMVQRYTRMLGNVRREMRNTRLEADNLGERMANAFEIAGQALTDSTEIFSTRLGDFADSTAVIAEGFRSITKEGSKGYEDLSRAIHVLNGLSAISAVLEQGKGDPYTAWGRMAAMAAAVAQMGYAVGFGGSSGSGQGAYVGIQERQGTGSVLGMLDQKSESIANATEITADATSELVGINRSMLEALQRVQVGIDGAVTRIARGGDFDFQAPGGTIPDLNRFVWDGLGLGSIYDTLDDFTFGIFGSIGRVLGGSSRHEDEGIRILGDTIGEMIDNTLVEAYSVYSTKRTAVSKRRRREQRELLDGDVPQQFALVFGSLVDSVVSGTEIMGYSADEMQARMEALEFETVQISLKDLNSEEQAEEISAVFSKVFDDLATNAVPFLLEMQRAGEGLGETLARVATQMQVGQEAVSRLGLNFVEGPDVEAVISSINREYQQSLGRQVDQEGLSYWFSEVTSGTISLSQALQAIRESSESTEYGLTGVAEAGHNAADVLGFTEQAVNDSIRYLAESFEHLVEASGGLEAFTQSMSSFLGNFASETYQFELAHSDITRALEQQNLALPETRQGYWDLMQAQEAATEQGADNIATLLRLQGVADSYYSSLESRENRRAQMEIQLSALQGDAVGALEASRSLELTALDESLHGIQRRIWALEDEQRISEQRSALELEVLRLTGREAEAVALQRNLELQAMDESLKSLQLRVWSLQDEQQLVAEVERKQEERNRQLEREASALDSARNTLAGFANTIQGWLDALRATDRGMGTPQQQLTAAQSDFAAQLVLAEQGDQAALRSITQYADRYLQAAQGMYASGQGSQYVLSEVQSALQALPEALTPEQFLADEFRDSISGQTESLSDQLSAMAQDIVLGSVGGSLELKDALSSKMDQLNTSVLTEEQVRAALAPIATDEEIDRLIGRVDVNGDGMISRQELTNSRISTLANGIANSLSPLFDKIDLNTDGLIDWNEFYRAFDGIATDSELKRIFNKLDADGSGQISRLEAIKGSTNKTDKNTENTNTRVGTSNDWLTAVSSHMGLGVQYQKDIRDRQNAASQGAYVRIAQNHNSGGTDYVAWRLADAMAKRGVGNGGTAYAKGGVFTNSVVSKPTFFNESLMGEAGPEAIMPLVRHSDGGLGVRAEIPDLRPISMQSDGASVGRELRELRIEVKRLGEENNKLMESLVGVSSQQLGVARQAHQETAHTLGKTESHLRKMSRRSRLKESV